MNTLKTVSNSEFPDLVINNFKFLFENQGFSIRSKQYTGHPLSEWIIVLTSEELDIQISIDKGLVCINLGIPDKKEMSIDLMFILMYITKNFEWNYLWPGGQINAQYYDKQLQHIATALSANFKVIKQTVQEITISKKEKKYFENFVKEYFQKSLEI